MKERLGDEKLIIISVAVRGMNDHIRFVPLVLSVMITVFPVSATLRFVASASPVNVTT